MNLRLSCFVLVRVDQPTVSSSCLWRNCRPGSDGQRRHDELEQYVVDKIVRDHVDQSYQGDPELPEMKSLEQMKSLYQWANDGRSIPQPEAYKILHKKFPVRQKNK
ncbi:MAG: hypothetical protein OXI73_14005 [Rhodospirillales bacterium]|nr:hypothetical protein [Rhodospirillales bacterium]